MVDLYERDAVLEGELAHALNTLEWVCKLTENPSELLMVAALAHDIDRVIMPREIQDENESYDDYKRRHSERGARLIFEFAKNYGYEESELNIISELVRLHEVGGTMEADILQDADSISFFDNNIEIYLKRKGYQETEAKLRWMYDRCSTRAQKVIDGLPKYREFMEAK